MLMIRLISKYTLFETCSAYTYIFSFCWFVRYVCFDMNSNCVCVLMTLISIKSFCRGCPICVYICVLYFLVAIDCLMIFSFFMMMIMIMMMVCVLVVRPMLTLYVPPVSAKSLFRYWARSYYFLQHHRCYVVGAPWTNRSLYTKTKDHLPTRRSSRNRIATRYSNAKSYSCTQEFCCTILQLSKHRWLFLKR